MVEIDETYALENTINHSDDIAEKLAITLMRLDAQKIKNAHTSGPFYRYAEKYILEALHREVKSNHSVRVIQSTKSKSSKDQLRDYCSETAIKSTDNKSFASVAREIWAHDKRIENGDMITLVDQPLGSQSPPDILILYKGKALAIEVKTSKSNKATMNSATIVSDFLYVFINTGEPFGLECFFGADLFENDYKSRYLKAQSELEALRERTKKDMNVIFEDLYEGSAVTFGNPFPRLKNPDPRNIIGSDLFSDEYRYQLKEKIIKRLIAHEV